MSDWLRVLLLFPGICLLVGACVSVKRLRDSTLVVAVATGLAVSLTLLGFANWLSDSGPALAFLCLLPLIIGATVKRSRRATESLPKPPAFESDSRALIGLVALSAAGLIESSGGASTRASPGESAIWQQLLIITLATVLAAVYGFLIASRVNLYFIVGSVAASILVQLGVNSIFLTCCTGVALTIICARVIDYVSPGRTDLQLGLTLWMPSVFLVATHTLAGPRDHIWLSFLLFLGLTIAAWSIGIVITQVVKLQPHERLVRQAANPTLNIPEHESAPEAQPTMVALAQGMSLDGTNSEQTVFPIEVLTTELEPEDATNLTPFGNTPARFDSQDQPVEPQQDILTRLRNKSRRDRAQPVGRAAHVAYPNSLRRRNIIVPVGKSVVK